MIRLGSEMFMLVYRTENKTLHMIKTKRNSCLLQASEITCVHVYLQDFYIYDRQPDKPITNCQHKFQKEHNAKNKLESR